MEHSTTTSSSEHHVVEHIILPLDAWIAVIVHYSNAQLPLVVSINSSTLAARAYTRSHSKELDNLIVHYDSHTNHVDRSGKLFETPINVQNVYPSRKYSHKQFRLCEFAARCTLMVRALLLETLHAVSRSEEDASACISRWPQFVQMLLLRIVLHRFSAPWTEETSLSIDEPTTTAARTSNGLAKLHLVLDWILRVRDEDSNDRRRATTTIASPSTPPLWLLRHIDMSCTNDALSRLMRTRHEWNEYGAQNNRVALPLSIVSRVKPCDLPASEDSSSTHSSPASSTSTSLPSLEHSNNSDWFDVHPYQLGLALSAVLSQVVHTIFANQREQRQMGVYHTQCAVCRSRWNMRNTNVQCVTSALYERIVMMLHSRSAVSSEDRSTRLCDERLNGAIHQQQTTERSPLYISHNSCHWCVLARTVCLAVLRVLRANKQLALSMRTAENHDNFRRHPSRVEILATVAMREQATSIAWRSSHSMDVTLSTAEQSRALSGADKNSAFNNVVWQALPIEKMLSQSLHAFKDSYLLIQQCHTHHQCVSGDRSYPAYLRKIISNVAIDASWRASISMSRPISMMHGGALQVAALYDLVNHVWVHGVMHVLPRIFTSMQQHLQELAQTTVTPNSGETHSSSSASSELYSLDPTDIASVECFALAKRYFALHHAEGWSELPTRIAAGNMLDTYMLYASLEAILTFVATTTPDGCIVSHLSILGAVVRQRAQCVVVDSLRAPVSTETSSISPLNSAYSNGTLLRWWVTPYCDSSTVSQNSPEREQYCSLADLQYTCMISTSMCATRAQPHSTPSKHGLPGQSQRTLVDPSETSEFAKDGRYNDISTVSIAHTVSMSRLWEMHVEDTSHPLTPLGLRMEILASVPRCPEQTVRMAVMCGTAEALVVMHDQREKSVATLYNGLDRRYRLPCDVSAPAFMQFLHHLYYGDDHQLASAVQWLFYRLFRLEKRCSEPSSPLAVPSPLVTRLLPVYLQHGDMALRHVRLLPMLLDSLAESDEERVCMIHDGLRKPFADVPRFMRSSTRMRYHQSKSVSHAVGEKNARTKDSRNTHGSSDTRNLYVDDVVITQALEPHTAKGWVEELLDELQVDTVRNTRESIPHSVGGETSCDSDESHHSTSDDAQRDAMDVQPTTPVVDTSNDRPQNNSSENTIDAPTTSEPNSAQSTCPRSTENLTFNLYHCTLYSNILAVLAPYTTRVCIATSTLRLVWRMLLDDYSLWIRHRYLVCVIIELLQVESLAKLVKANNGKIPLWYIWRTMRMQYVDWRREQQQARCPSPNARHQYHFRLQKPSVALAFERLKTCRAEPGKSAASARDDANSNTTRRTKREPDVVTRLWCYCYACAQVSCSNTLPQWTSSEQAQDTSTHPTDDVSSDSSNHASHIPGYWCARRLPQGKLALLNSINKDIYVLQEQYIHGPAARCGIFHSSVCDSLGHPYAVYDPLCSIPPYPSEENERAEWYERSVFPAGHAQNKQGRYVFGQPDYLDLTPSSSLVPDLDPPHLLFYSFACDPQINTNVRAEIFMSIQAVRGIDEREFYPSEPVACDREQMLSDYRTSAEFNSGWMEHYLHLEEERSALLVVPQQQAETLKSMDSSEIVSDDQNTLLTDWLAESMPPLTWKQTKHQVCMPMHGIAVLATMSDVMAFLPHISGCSAGAVVNREPTVEPLQSSMDVAVQQPSSGDISRANIPLSMLRELSDPTLICDTFASLRKNHRTFPITWTKSPFSTPSAEPADEVLQYVQDWMSPKACYSHDSLPVFDAPFTPCNTSVNCKRFGRKPCERQHCLLKPGPFSLSMPETVHKVLTNPVMQVHDDARTIARLESVLLRQATLVQNVLDHHEGLSVANIYTPTTGFDVSQSDMHLIDASAANQIGHRRQGIRRDCNDSFGSGAPHQHSLSSSTSGLFYGGTSTEFTTASHATPVMSHGMPFRMVSHGPVPQRTERDRSVIMNVSTTAEMYFPKPLDGVDEFNARNYTIESLNNGVMAEDDERRTSLLRTV